MEVVAKKANLLVAYIFVVLIGAAILIGGVVLGLVANQTGAIVIGVVIGGILTAYGVFVLVRFIKTPKVLISYADGVYTFADGTTCTPAEITHVLIKLTRSNGVVNPTGGIVVTINDTRKIEYKTVSQVKRAQQRMQEIADEYIAAQNSEPQAGE